MLIDTIIRYCWLGTFLPVTCMPSSTTGRCWSIWWVRTTSVACWLWAAGTPWRATGWPSRATPNTSTASTTRSWTTVRQVRPGARALFHLQISPEWKKKETFTYIFSYLSVRPVSRWQFSNSLYSRVLRNVDIFKAEITYSTRWPGETTAVLDDWDLQPEERGEEIQRAAGPGAVPLRLLHPDDGRRAGGRAVQSGARLLQIPPAVHQQDRPGGLVCSPQPGKHRHFLLCNELIKLPKQNLEKYPERRLVTTFFSRLEIIKSYIITKFFGRHNVSITDFSKISDSYDILWLF